MNSQRSRKGSAQERKPSQPQKQQKPNPGAEQNKHFYVQSHLWFNSESENANS
jgi:hypothetical protein